MRKKFLFIISMILILTFSFIFMELKKCIKQLPSIEELQSYTPNLTTKIYDINEKLIDEFYIQRRTFTPLDQIPKYLIDAIIAIEDDNFYDHWGISVSGITRALIKNIAARRVVQGGSTITQQLAKGLFLTREKKVSRKIKEALLSLQLEYRYSKNEILEMYLNHIYFGHGIYGINLAADLYFNKKVGDLSLEECATLASMPKAPSFYSPFKHPDALFKRRNLVLTRMAAQNFITEEEAEAAKNSPLTVAEKKIKEKYASYFVEYIRQKLEPYYGELLYKGGLKIFTTLDLDMQIAAFETLEKHLAKFDEKRKEEIIKNIKNPILDEEESKYIPYESTETYKNVQGAVIALDTKTGQIRALVGGRDFKESQFNRAIQAKRQPGSGFKPIIFTTALDQGWTATDILIDEPAIYYNNGHDWELAGNTTDYSDVDPELLEKVDIEDIMQIWAPSNYTEKYLGEITLRKALEKSINICAIELLRQVTPSAAAHYAKKLGIVSRVNPYLSMALGSFVVTPLEITNTYATLANHGVKTTPYAIIKIYDNNGQLLEENFPEEKVAISEKTAYLITNLLKGVILNGTGRRARALRREAAGKTGTTNNYTDTWFIGYTPSLVTTVWVGHDDQKTLGKNQTGGGLSCPIWTDFMKEALLNKPKLSFAIPRDIIFVPINKQAGLRALELNKDSYMEAFLKGTEPQKLAVYDELFSEEEGEEEDEKNDEKEYNEEEEITNYLINISTAAQ